jgi:glucosamine--fructose-6-phosphate aminotransferase (isomerizing)
MCGVFGYVGQQRDVGESILAALKRLEYRGYDSWGLAIATPDGLVVEKETGRINGHVRPFPSTTIGLGHTRWATHGGVTRENAHPHTDCGQRIAVVHNGIIENHAALKSELAQRGHDFRSETDSEVVAHLVEERLAAGYSLAEAVAQVFQVLEGFNAVVVMDSHATELVAVKRTSPLVVGQGRLGATIASDAFALQGHADRLFYLDDGQLAVLRSESCALLDSESLRPVPTVPVAARDDRVDSALGGHPDFLSKEVAEQPAVLRRLVSERMGEIAALGAEIRAADRVVLIGCGSAGHAALAGSYFLAEVCGIDAPFVPASEFRFRAGSCGEGTLVIALSQSGETIDVLEAMSEARGRGARLAAIVNTPNSSLDRMAELRVHLGTGIEQCVLATKSYTAMLATLLLAAFHVAGDPSTGVATICHASDAIQQILEPRSRQQIRRIGTELAAVEHLFVVGRGAHYPSALEAALKIKEVSYLHAEGFAAGELKHGVIALIASGTPCLVLAPDDETRTDILSSASELRSRGAHIIGVGPSADALFDDFIPVASAGPASVIVEAVPGQLLGYAAALARGHDPDRPRNLAKCVTVK